jgi:hypothetical protein
LFHFHTWIHSTPTISVLLHSFIMPSLFSLVPTSGKELFYLLVFQFLKKYIFVCLQWLYRQGFTIS